VLAGLKGTRTPMYYTLDEKTRLAGCLMIREAVERVILEEGVDAYKQFVREVIEDGRRSFQSRVRETLIPGRYRSPAFQDLRLAHAEQLPSYARRDHLMHAAVELRVTTEASSSSTTTAPRPGATTPTTARRRPCRVRYGCS
jgi:N-methylhydantoinase B/oxoprolinase/acetone carboxylase alpha subunit